MNEVPRFVYGFDFERYCSGGYSSSELEYPRSNTNDFKKVISDSIGYAAKSGLDESKLKERRAFFWRVFCEVRQHIPKIDRHKLRLFITLGTPIDFLFGGDFVFLLGSNRFVICDVTLNVMDRNKYLKPHPNCLIFTQYQLYPSSIVRFSRQVARLLRDGEYLEREVSDSVEGLLMQYNNSS